MSPLTMIRKPLVTALIVGLHVVLAAGCTEAETPKSITLEECEAVANAGDAKRIEAVREVCAALASKSFRAPGKKTESVPMNWSVE